MAQFDLDAWVARARAIDLDAVPWADVPRYPVSADVVRTLTYMQEIEFHTIIYLRSLLHTRAVDEQEVATFLACWVHEETFHGLALSRFLEAAGHRLPPRARPRGQEPTLKRLEAWSTAVLSRAWPDFCALHMVWGAINELTALTAYNRLRTLSDHPVLADLLEQIARDESRHFFFYYRQAERRLGRPVVARAARLLIDRFWAPVGSGVAAPSEVRFMARYLFAGDAGRQAARRVDDTIRRLPGFADVQLLEAWMDRHAGPQGLNGGRNGHRHH
jgi:tRNA isopentenyl-2-thiomethyl-A-37 hydroxylase MiaE